MYYTATLDELRASLLTFHIIVLVVVLFFFFKQKTAYEMRISDWSSDVCSSDLAERRVEECAEAWPLRGHEQRTFAWGALHIFLRNLEIGERIRFTVHVVERAFGPAALLEHQPGARLHQRVDRRTIAVRVVAAVAGDRADDQARTERAQRLVVDAEFFGFAGRMR